MSAPDLDTIYTCILGKCVNVQVSEHDIVLCVMLKVKVVTIVFGLYMFI